MSQFIKTFGYDVVTGIGGKPVDACAKFIYKGYEVSFSTVGRSEGACPQEVVVFPEGSLSMGDALGYFTRVEEAIDFIDRVKSSTTVEKVKRLLQSVGFKGKYVAEGVLSREEAKSRAQRTGTVIIISSMKDKTFFYSDDHCFGYKVLPDNFVPCTTSLPMSVVAREGLEDGIIDTLEKYESVFCDGYTRIESLEQLALYVP